MKFGFCFYCLKRLLEVTNISINFDNLHFSPFVKLLQLCGINESHSVDSPVNVLELSGK